MTSVLILKPTMVRPGIWEDRPFILTHTAKGWHDMPAPPPSRSQGGRNG